MLSLSRVWELLISDNTLYKFSKAAIVCLHLHQLFSSIALDPNSPTQKLSLTFRIYLSHAHALCVFDGLQRL